MIKENYEMIIAGKIRTFKEVCLTPSRTGVGEIITNSEFKRLSFIVCKEICFSEELITLEELEFLRNLFESTQVEVAQVMELNEKDFSNWKNSKIDSSLSVVESFIIKSFFKKKWIEISQKS